MLSKNSIKTYNCVLNTLAKDLGYESDLLFPDGWHWLSDHKHVIDVIKLRSDKVCTQSTKLYGIKYILELTEAPKELIEKYSEFGVELKKSLSDWYDNKRKSEKEESNWLTVSDLYTILDNLEYRVPKRIKNENDYKILMKYLILKLHLEVPLRNDLCDSKILLDPLPELFEDVSYNYIILSSHNNSAKYINNVYKTSKTYGKIEFDWSKDVAKDLFYYYEDIKKMNNENFFIVDRDKKKMTRNNFTRFLNSIFIPFNKQVSSTMLRHIIISELYQLDEEKEKIKRDLSKKMGHAMSSSGSFYAKLLTKA